MGHVARSRVHARGQIPHDKLAAGDGRSRILLLAPIETDVLPAYNNKAGVISYDLHESLEQALFCCSVWLGKDPMIIGCYARSPATLGLKPL